MRNEYPETISENVSVMNDMLALIYSKWPDIKVNIILLPIYKGILDKREPYYIKWKKFLRRYGVDTFQTEIS